MARRESPGGDLDELTRLLMAWIVALTLSVVFGLYPALKASRLSPMEAMR